MIHIEDAFFKKINLTLGSSGTFQNQNVDLDRMVSEITVNIEDAIPQNVKFLCVQISDDNFQGRLPNHYRYLMF